MNNLPEKRKDNRLAILRNTVAKGLNSDEFAMFLELCKATKLNPFKREIWAIKGKSYTARNGTHIEGSLQLMTGFNGYLAIANAHPQFDGMETEIVKNDNGTIDYAETKVYRKDRKFPSTARCYFKEFYKPGFNDKPSQWDKQPAVMIAKCSKSHALREAFPQELSGFYTQEELGEEAPKVTFEQVNQLNAVKDTDISEDDIDNASEQAAIAHKSYEELNQEAEKEALKQEAQ